MMLYGQRYCNMILFEESPFKELVQAAVQAKNRAYCPYSNFHVGAAVLTANDQVVAGNYTDRSTNNTY